MDFADLKTVTADQLMYVKEDLIIPQTNTFYDFIVIKARGKSGPLFAFDVHDDVRLVNDASVEKDESHAGTRPLQGPIIVETGISFESQTFTQLPGTDKTIS